MMNNVYEHAAILNIFYFSTGLYAASSPVNHCKQIDFMEQIMLQWRTETEKVKPSNKQKKLCIWYLRFTNMSSH